jgi:hypothetical protein
VHLPGTPQTEPAESAEEPVLADRAV